MRPAYHSNMAPPPPPNPDDDSKLVKSTRETPAMKRLGKVIQEKKRLNSTINNRSKRLHDMSKSFRRQTLQENNRNLARALQKYKEQKRCLEDQIVELKREKQELIDELGTLRQIVGKKDIELNAVVEERVEKRLSEIRQSASQLMDMCSHVVSLCLSDRINFSGRSSSALDGSSVEEQDNSGDRVNEQPTSQSQPLYPVERPSQQPDLSLIAESSFLDHSQLAPIQFTEDNARYLGTVTETDEERRSRSRSSSRSRRSGLLTRSLDTLPDPGRHRSRSRSGSKQAANDAKHANTGRHSDTEQKVHLTPLENERRSESEKEPKNGTDNTKQRHSAEKDVKKDVPRISLNDSKGDLTVPEFLRHRFPGGDKIARTPPRASSSNPGSAQVTPHGENQSVSAETTPKYDAFDVQLENAQGPKVVNSFDMTQKPITNSPKVVKKSTNATFSFIPLDDEKPKSGNSKPTASRVQKVTKKAENTKSRKPREKDRDSGKHMEVQSETEGRPPETRRRRTYSLESDRKLNKEPEPEMETEGETNLNGTFEKEAPEVLPADEKLDNEVLETMVAMGADSVAKAIGASPARLQSENLDDSLGVLDATVLDTLDMELTEVVPAGIRLDNSAAEKEIPQNDEQSLDVPVEKPSKRVRRASPHQDPGKEDVPEKQRKRNPSGRRKKHNSESEEVERDKKLEPEVENVVQPETRKRHTSGRRRRSKTKEESAASDDSTAEDTAPVPKSRTKTKVKAVAPPVEDKANDSANDSTSSADESAATFHYYRSKPGKLNFVVGRKDQNGRPNDPVSMMKKSSRSKNAKKKPQQTTSQSEKDENEDNSPYDWNPEDNPEEVQKEDEEKKKEADKAVFKVPAARRTKPKKLPNIAVEESNVKPRSRRTTTVIKSYKETTSGDEASPAGKKDVKVVPSDDAAQSRRQTKIIRRVSSVPKPEIPPPEDVPMDDVTTHVIDDTVINNVTCNDVTMDTSDVSQHDGSLRKETKTYGQIRRETQIVKPKTTIPKLDMRRQTQVIAKPEIKQTEPLPPSDVTLPEPESLPFNASEPEIEEPPSVNQTMEEPDEEMTLDLTKLIKSMGRQKILSKAAQPEVVDDEMTLDLTKLLKGIDREKMAREAVPRPETVPKPPPQAPASKLPPPKPLPRFSSSQSDADLSEPETAPKKPALPPKPRLSIDGTVLAKTSENTKSRSKIARKKEPKSKPAAKTPLSDNSSSVNLKPEMEENLKQKSRPSVELEDISPLLKNEQGQIRTSLNVDDVTPRRSRTPRNSTENAGKTARASQSRDQTTTKKAPSSRRKGKESVEPGSDVEDENEDPNVQKRLSYAATSPKRPRRGQTTSYKEPSLNTKMRRDAATDDGKKTKKRSKNSTTKRSVEPMED